MIQIPRLMVAATIAGVVALAPTIALGFTVVPSQQSFNRAQSTPTTRLKVASSSTTTDVSKLESSVSQLKKVLEKEYVSFFDPMRKEYYADDVTFLDPMTTLSGVDSYQSNVDMLASRTLLGSLLFQDAGINLHSVEGGEITPEGSIQDITTRWTLRVTAKILPWAPTARFTGISVYQVKPSTSPEGVVITGQVDYWDSINIAPNNGGTYQKVETSLAVKDFLDQLNPGGFQAVAAAPELPYQLLRRGNGYQVRRYPSYSAVQLSSYQRRDEAYDLLGSFTRGMSPLSPAIMEVPNDTSSDKRMMWPLGYAAPGQETASAPEDALAKSQEGTSSCQVTVLPSRVVAVAEFSDASLEPVVRKADKELRIALERDGLRVPESTAVQFAQFDAIHSMGKRRGEVWVDLEDGGHPW